MEKQEKFIKEIQKGYTCKGSFITLGAGILDGESLKDARVKIPLKMLNRHGLISGATGTGKTKTLQGLAGALSDNGVPVLLMDIKGDLSGLAKSGEKHPAIQERHQQIGLPFNPKAYPVELLTLSKEKGARLRATISEFGPILLSKILGLNENQTGVLSVVFQYCDDQQIPLVDLKDLKKTLRYLSEEGKDEIKEEYGAIAKNSVGAIIRKVLEIEQQGGRQFFGERSLEVDDLLRKDQNGKGYISILRLADIQDRPRLFSTFMLSLLAEIYAAFPEQGDIVKPKLVIFIDEAHLIFEDASKALQDQLEAIVKLIRSKGVGIFFCTQLPTDVPKEILGQLGLKIQHALRAFTAADRKAIKLTAQNYPTSSFYKTDQLLTQLGIGEALVTALNEKGIPTPLVATLLCAPKSRMGPLTKSEIEEIVNSSQLVRKYNEKIDAKSAYEILNEKIEAFNRKKVQEKLQSERVKAQKSISKRGKPKTSIERVMGSTMARQMGRTFIREVTRALLGVLGLGGRSRRR